MFHAVGDNEVPERRTACKCAVGDILDTFVGRNGAGKSTFLKMLMGQVRPDSGSIVIGDTVNIGYFSQECESMDPALRVIEYIRETADRVQTPDGVVTASQMLERFLFTPELQWNRIEKLSGGERKRLYLLKILMTAQRI